MSAPLRILFVCGADFRSPSEKQALWFAEELLRQGHGAMISHVGDAASAEAEGATQVPGLVLQRHRLLARRLARDDVAAARAFAPDVVHAYNARVHVAAAASAYASATGAPLFVHWEDDEWQLRGGLPNPPRLKALLATARRLTAPLRPAGWVFPTDASLAWAVREAAAFDAVAPALAEHVAERTGRPCIAILPVLARDLPSSAPPVLPRSISRRPFALYTGHVHAAREHDVWLALRAVARAQARGIDIGFVQAGGMSARAHPAAMVREAGLAEGSAVFLGHLPFSTIPALLQQAAVLVQPDRGSELNRLGLPSKLQAYLASGTPVVTYAAGPGELLRDRDEVLKTSTGTVDELADRIEEALGDPRLRATLQRGGPAAARRLFDPARNTATLVAHYRAVLAGA